jgi:hypothetical protein
VAIRRFTIWSVVGSFADQVAAFEKDARRKMDLAVRRVSLEIFSRVILKSPVDTGRFRGNWQVAIGSIPSGTLELDDKTGTATVSKADLKLVGAKAGDTIYLANNLPYAVRLEEGYSKTQAPQGMVALTVQEFAAIVDAIGIELSRQ